MNSTQARQLAMKLRMVATLEVHERAALIEALEARELEAQEREAQEREKQARKKDPIRHFKARLWAGFVDMALLVGFIMAAFWIAGKLA